jgi:hypothetical protein
MIAYCAIENQKLFLLNNCTLCLVSISPHPKKKNP